MIYDLSDRGGLPPSLAAFGIGANDAPTRRWAEGAGDQAGVLAVIFEFIGASQDDPQGDRQGRLLRGGPAIMYGMFSVIMPSARILATKYGRRQAPRHERRQGQRCSTRRGVPRRRDVVLLADPRASSRRPHVRPPQQELVQPRVKVYPILVTLCVTTIAWYMLKKGIKVQLGGRRRRRRGTRIVCAILMIPVYKIMQNSSRRRSEKIKVAKKTSLEASSEKPEVAPVGRRQGAARTRRAVGVDERTTYTAREVRPEDGAFALQMRRPSSTAARHGRSTIYIEEKSEMDDNKTHVAARHRRRPPLRAIMRARRQTARRAASPR